MKNVENRFNHVPNERYISIVDVLTGLLGLGKRGEMHVRVRFPSAYQMHV